MPIYRSHRAACIVLFVFAAGCGGDPEEAVNEVAAAEREEVILERAGPAEDSQFVHELSFQALAGGGRSVRRKLIAATERSLLTEEIKLVPGGDESVNNFGRAIGFGARTIVAGAIGDGGAGPDAGAVFVFRDTSAGGDWTRAEMAALRSRETAASDRFGYSLALHGRTLLVGAPKDDDRGVDSGSAFIFRDIGDSADWGRIAEVRLTAPDGAPDDQFGNAVALEGSTAVVGAGGDDDRGPFSGSVYVFSDKSDSGDWSSIGVTKLIARDGAPGDIFGAAVAVSGRTILIGASGDDDKGGSSGSAYLFRDTSLAGDWSSTSQIKLRAADASPRDEFGSVVAIDGRRAVIGAPFDRDLGTDSGSAYVFLDTSPAGDWSAYRQRKLMAEDAAMGANFGSSVAVKGSTVIVGAHHESAHGRYAGAFYVYQGIGSETNAPVQAFKFTATDPIVENHLGQSIAMLNENILVAGANDEIGTSASGAIYLFRLRKLGVSSPP